MSVSRVTVRLDHDYVRLERKLDAARESVRVLMDKKEVLEATRHATLLKCLEEVNDALKGIYRRLTSVEGKENRPCTKCWRACRASYLS